MRVVIQRVSKASVSCESGREDSIGLGMLVLLGIEEADTDEDVKWLSSKISRLRIFADENGIMNKDIMESKGEILVISQFTLHASTKKGNRPSYIKAAKPETAVTLYHKFIEALKFVTNIEVKQGVFGDHMDVSLVNDGPVTIIIDTKNKE